MLLSSGCSFTVGSIGDGRYVDKSYPKLLAEKLNVKLHSLADPGSDNNLILDQAIHYLLVYKQYEMPEPSYVTVQTTDFFRRLVFNRKQSGAIIPGKFSTQSRIRKNFTKINNWNYENQFQEPSLQVHTRTFHIKSFNSSYPSPQEAKEIKTVLDSTQNHHALETLLKLAQLKLLCDTNNIPLLIVNYYGFGYWKQDPLYHIIKPNLLIENADYGLYNELLWLNFDRPDDYHFDQEAHNWQAETFYNFLITNKKITVNEKDPPSAEFTKPSDYTEELEIYDQNKLYER